ncbi:hypothetical protein AB3S75_046493 [Citrus x aurantiifolia]
MCCNYCTFCYWTPVCGNEGVLSTLQSSIDSVSLQFSQSSLAISGENLVDVGTLK